MSRYVKLKEGDKVLVTDLSHEREGASGKVIGFDKACGEDIIIVSFSERDNDGFLREEIKKIPKKGNNQIGFTGPRDDDGRFMGLKLRPVFIDNVRFTRKEDIEIIKSLWAISKKHNELVGEVKHLTDMVDIVKKHLVNLKNEIRTI